MFIRTEANHLINVRYLRDIAIWGAGSIRQRKYGEGWITHHNAPITGHCVIGWDKDESPVWLTNGHPEHVAEIVLQHLYAALEAQAPAFDVAAIIEVISPKTTAAISEIKAT
jgi:hypothetical protein